jgi:CrcB protein
LAIATARQSNEIVGQSTAFSQVDRRHDWKSDKKNGTSASTLPSASDDGRLRGLRYDNTCFVSLPLLKPHPMLNYLWISLGGALGTAARFWLSGIIAQSRETFPWGTLVVNISGSFMVGICGGYTTFSSFSLQTLRLAQEKQWLYAGANILGSVVLCLLAVWLGHLFAEALNKK